MKKQFTEGHIAIALRQAASVTPRLYRMEGLSMRKKIPRRRAACVNGRYGQRHWLGTSVGVWTLCLINFLTIGVCGCW